MHSGVFAALLAVILGCASPPAAACRPFGSYQFAEDRAGGIWFTEGDNNAISRMAPDGGVRSYPLPTPNAEPTSIALDREGRVWFVESEGRKIGRLDRDGRITEYPTNNGHPVHVAVDAQGEAWFTQMSGHENGRGHAGHDGPPTVAKVGRVDRNGVMHSYPLQEGWPTSIAFDRRNRAWVSILVPGNSDDRPKGRLARLSRNGKWIIEAAWDNSCPSNLVSDARGGVYFSDGCRKLAAYRSARAVLSEWKMPTDSAIQQLATARDGGVWFTDRRHLGRIDRHGRVSLVDRPDNGDATMAVLATRGGDVVFSEFYNYNINRLTRSGELVEHLVNVEERRGSRTVKEGEFCRIEFGARIAAKAEMDRKRAEEVRNGRFKPDGAGTEKLVAQKCLVCHDARRLLLSRRSDWTPSITRMHAYRDIRGVEPLTVEESGLLVRYFNENYGLAR